MKKSFLWIGIVFTVTSVSAGNKRVIECRLATPKTTECKPYPSKFMYTEKLTYGEGRQKLIIAKTLPPVKKPKILKVVNVEDMIESHLEILEPVRFRGSQPSPLRISQKELARKKAKLAQIEKRRKEIEEKLVALIQERAELQLKLMKLRRRAETAEQEKIRKEAEEAAKKERIARKKLEKEKLEKAKKEAEKKRRLAEEKKKKAIKKKKALAKKKKKPKQSELARKLEKKYRYLNKRTRQNIINEYETKLFKTLKGKRKLRVQATAYTSHRGQTDKTPFLAAWNNRLRPGMKVIAVSRDLIRKYGLGNGKKVRIQGLPGYYTVRDKMNKRYTKRIDIYMGTNRRKALRWGRKRVVIYW